MVTLYKHEAGEGGGGAVAGNIKFGPGIHPPLCTEGNGGRYSTGVMLGVSYCTCDNGGGVALGSCWGCHIAPVIMEVLYSSWQSLCGVT